MLAILIQLFIAAFSSFLVVGLTSMYDPSSIEGGQINVGIAGETQDKLVQAGAREEGITVLQFQSEEDALAAFDRGGVDAVLVGRNTPTEQGTRVTVEAIVPAEDLRTTLIVVQVRSMLTELERSERILRSDHLSFTPLQVPGEVNASPQFGFTYTILIPLLLFLPAFISGSIVVDSFTEEIERGTLELLRVAPVSLTDIVDGKAAGMILIAPGQALLWLVLLRLNGIAISHIVSLLVLVSALTTITVVIGLLLGLATGNRQQAQLLYSVIVLLLFGAALVLPEHPATTIALLAVDSATLSSFAYVAMFAVLAVVLYGVTRQYVAQFDPESL